MKEGWDKKPLGELCRIELGSTPARKSAALWDTDKSRENVWLSIADMPQCLHASAIDSKEYVSDLAAKSMKIVPAGTLLVSFKLTLGRLAYAGRDLFTNEAIAALHDIDTERLSKEFLYWALSAFDWEKAAEGDQKVKGKTLNKAKLKLIPIPLPPLEEQRRIVAVLDEAFEGLDRARANAEANLQNARELFRNTLAERTNSENFPKVMLGEVCDVRDGTHDTPKYVDDGVPLVTQKNIRPEGLSLDNVKLISLDDHTAIHRRSNVAEGDILISMIGVNRGMSCLVDRDEVFSIKNVGLIKDTPEVNMSFLLYYLKSADAEKYVEEATNGGAQPFIGLGKLRAFPTLLPERAEQDRIATELTEMKGFVQVLAANYEAQIKDFDDIHKSLLQKAFTGQLTISQPKTRQTIASNDKEVLSAQVLALAYSRHLTAQREKTFGHVKAQKVLNLTEALCGIDLGREPIRDAAGPNDMPQMRQMEKWARNQRAFRFKQRTDRGYTFEPLSNFDSTVRDAQEALSPNLSAFNRLIDLIVSMDTQETEVLATIHAAWNNLIIDGVETTEDAIVTAAREDWHPDKMKIERQKFFEAISTIRRAGIEPDGSAKYVPAKQEQLL